MSKKKSPPADEEDALKTAGADVPVEPKPEKAEVPEPKKPEAKPAKKSSDRKVTIRNFEYRNGQIHLRDHALVKLDDKGIATVPESTAAALQKYFPATEIVE